MRYRCVLVRTNKALPKAAGDAKKAQELQSDEDLNPVRDRPDFRQVLAAVKQDGTPP